MTHNPDSPEKLAARITIAKQEHEQRIVEGTDARERHLKWEKEAIIPALEKWLGSRSPKEIARDMKEAWKRYRNYDYEEAGLSEEGEPDESFEEVITIDSPAPSVQEVKTHDRLPTRHINKPIRKRLARDGSRDWFFLSESINRWLTDKKFPEDIGFYIEGYQDEKTREILVRFATTASSWRSDRWGATDPDND